MSNSKILFARSLRRNYTDAESYLWSYLRNRQLGNTKFRRQQLVGKYIVDFVAFERMLVVEIDGSPHRKVIRKNKDRTRSMYLESLGYSVVRFWNNEVLDNVEGVLEVIKNILEKNPSSSPSPSGEGNS